MRASVLSAFASAVGLVPGCNIIADATVERVIHGLNEVNGPN
ncbi:MAG: hypothetical protein ABNH02_06485 [Pseudomonadales bacterium]